MLQALIALTLGRPSPTVLFDPTRTWVFAVSCLQFKNRDFSSIPESGRTDTGLIDTFRSKGVPADHFVVIQDKRAETKRVDFEFREMLGRVKPGGILFVYYTGHGYVQKGQLMLATWNAEVGGPGWRMTRAFSQIGHRFRGSAVVFTADCCASGRLVDFASASKKPVAVLSSGQADSDVPEGWTFTTSLAQALSGEGSVDLDGDGQIDWGETVTHVQASVRQATGTPGWSYVPDGFALGWPIGH